MNPKSKLFGGDCTLQKEAGGFHGTVSLHSPMLLKQVKRKKVTARTSRK